MNTADLDRIAVEVVEAIGSDNGLGTVRGALWEVHETTQQEFGECICITAGPDVDGPAATCPQHGQPYAYWVEGYMTLQRRIDAYRERDLQIIRLLSKPVES